MEYESQQLARNKINKMNKFDKMNVCLHLAYILGFNECLQNHSSMVLNKGRHD